MFSAIDGSDRYLLTQQATNLSLMGGLQGSPQPRHHERPGVRCDARPPTPHLRCAAAPGPASHGPQGLAASGAAGRTSCRLDELAASDQRQETPRTAQTALPNDADGNGNEAGLGLSKKGPQHDRMLRPPARLGCPKLSSAFRGVLPQICLLSIQGHRGRQCGPLVAACNLPHSGGAAGFLRPWYSPQGRAAALIAPPSSLRRALRWLRSGAARTERHKGYLLPRLGKYPPSR